MSKWWDVSWNPVTGCTPISEGCEHCYAKRLVETRFADNDKATYHDFSLRVHPDKLGQYFGGLSKRVFCGSMTDLFQKELSPAVVLNILANIRRQPLHLFIICTKRADRMRRIMSEYAKWNGVIENLVLMVTAENQARFDERTAELFQTPAAYRAVSIEPLLGRITMDGRIGPVGKGEIKLDWVIVGGESGPGARNNEPEWFDEIYQDCVTHGIPFFFKQRGSAISKEFQGYSEWETVRQFPKFPREYTRINQRESK